MFRTESGVIAFAGFGSLAIATGFCAALGFQNSRLSVHRLFWISSKLDSGKRPSNFDLDRIEAQQSRQFGNDWPDVKRLLEALLQIGIYYDDVHNKNIRLRQKNRQDELPVHPA